jgi:hypothetical protein
MVIMREKAARSVGGRAAKGAGVHTRLVDVSACTQPADESSVPRSAIDGARDKVWLGTIEARGHPVPGSRAWNRSNQIPAVTFDPHHRTVFWQPSVMRTPGSAPASFRSLAMFKRRRFKQMQPLEERLMEEAKSLRDAAKVLQPGRKREEKLRKARQDEVAAQITEWLASPGLRGPV